MGPVAWDDLGVGEAGSQCSSYDELLTVVRGIPALAAGPVEGPETGWQVGRAGSGLMPASAPDRTETAAVPEDCSLGDTWSLGD